MATDFLIQIIILLFSLFLGITGIVLWKRHKDNWFVFFPTVFYALHSTIFYSLIILATLEGTSISHFLNSPVLISSTWSAILRLHGIITLICFLSVANSCMRVIYGRNITNNS